MLENVGVMNGNACIWKPAPKNSAEFTAVVNGKTYYGYSDWDAIVERPGFILMQFTGLKDKSGKEIYEGDVLSDDGVPCRVIFETAGWCYQDRMSHRSFWLFGSAEVLEVIGNIYENPELLEAK